VTEHRGEKSDLIEKVIKISRVAKVVKGGRRFSFSALVVVGDGRGRVGYGLGKANEVTEAIRKGIDQATKSMKPIVIEGRSIPHIIKGHFGASNVILRPASAGFGIIASGPVRAVVEAVGVQDISAKSLGAHNPHNVVKATLNALYNLRSYEDIAARRGVSAERMRQVRLS
jgi:small subunit ribosomal protein S5